MAHVFNIPVKTPAHLAYLPGKSPSSFQKTWKTQKRKMASSPQFRGFFSLFCCCSFFPSFQRKAENEFYCKALPSLVKSKRFTPAKAALQLLNTNLSFYERQKFSTPFRNYWNYFDLLGKLKTYLSQKAAKAWIIIPDWRMTWHG